MMHVRGRRRSLGHARDRLALQQTRPLWLIYGLVRVLPAIRGTQVPVVSGLGMENDRWLYGGLYLSPAKRLLPHAVFTFMLTRVGLRQIPPTREEPPSSCDGA